MRLLIKLTLRSIQRHPARTILSMLGITIGVAGILALGITNQASMQSISALFEESSGKVDLMVTASSDNQPLSEGTIRVTENIAAVRVVLPIVKANTAFADQASGGGLELSFLGMDSGGFLLHGVNPVLEPLARDYKIVEGRFLEDPLEALEVVLVESYAQDEDIQVGDRVEVLTPNGVERLRVVGLIAREGPGQINNGAFGIVPLNTAQRMFNRLGEYDQLDLLLTESNSSQALEEVRLAIQRRLGEAVSVTYPAGQGQRMSQMLSNYQIGLNFLSGIALFVGAFLIYNAFAMTVVERTREFGMLRTIGMTRRQIILQVISEALVLGIFGSGLGVLMGILGARGLAGLVGSLLGTDLSADLVVPGGTLLLSLFVGIIVTIIGALMPSIQAGQVSPIAALRVRGRSQEGWITRSGWKFGIAGLLVSTAILLWNPFPYDPQFILGSLTVFLMFGGVTLMIPGTVSTWEKLSRPLMRLIFRNSGLIGSRNIGRSKVRTTLTIVALLIGVAMILVVRVMTASFSQDLVSWINAYIGGDIYIHSSVPLRADMANQVAGITGVGAATPIHYQNIEFMAPGGGLEPLTFMAVDPATYTRVTSFIFSDSNINAQAALAELNDGGALFISSVIAEKYNLGVGDRFWIRTNQGLQDFSIAAVVVDFFNQGLVVTGNRHDLRRFFRSNEISTILVKVDAGVPTADVIANIEQVYGKRYHLSLESNETIRGNISVLMDQAFSMFDVMAVLAVLISSLGIVNTLMMNIMERTQEIGMLRAIGMTRGQVIKMVLSEAGLMGVIGGLVGLVFGVLLAKIFLTGMTAMSGYRLDFIVPLGGVITSLVVALVISQLAAIQPARKASRTNILEAIHYE
ncbi:MAG: FtsX-like permease family protein [Brevefilum sp.]|nr:FtsX-like permease family protein [Brevefilum sp.]